MGYTGYSTKENVNNIKVTHLHWGLQLIFDESQKEGNNEIWIDIYPLTRFLTKHTQAAVKVEGTKEWVRTNGILDPAYKIEPEQFEFRDFSHEEVVFGSETDRCIYEYVCTNGFITTQQIIELTRITTKQGANAALGRLMKQNLVKKVRKGRHFIYELK